MFSSLQNKGFMAMVSLPFHHTSRCQYIIKMKMVPIIIYARIYYKWNRPQPAPVLGLRGRSERREVGVVFGRVFLGSFFQGILVLI